MALKDWKKRKNTNTWENSKKNLIIRISIDKFVMKDHTFQVHVWKDSKSIKHEPFKTKAQALRFAKSYMRSH